ncbi:hypothetical protein [Clostridium ganghwense]|uniref:Spore coat protein n=1 Tax=Clostridium ganghwense TaxID=312089 RepID=A0ABT4CRF7_9CLOT|nr:hypothetical protein [Clostridium ganghwense]MCY6371645.1 hypothetical protein [Clostridium ganghwense]
MMATQTKQLEDKNLKVIKDQIEYEALMNKKFSQYSNSCTDQQLKSLCQELSGVHRSNFDNLKNYLDSHQ